MSAAGEARVAGTTRLLGVIGDPVAHSLSPRMQNAALHALGLDWAYVPLRVDAARLDAALAGLVALSFVGANVTIPHKEAVASRCDHLTPVAAACGSVNTLVVEADGTLSGDSTDGAAVVDGVHGHGIDADAPALVLGAGGSARSVVAALAAAGHAVTVVARRPEAAWVLAQALSGSGAVTAAAAVPAHLPPIVVNCTPLGGASALTDLPLAADTIRDARVVVDLAYRPDARPTLLVAAAQAHGLPVVDGLDVLVGQGALALERWCGRRGPRDVMRAALAG